jgi:hypothetical protein
MMHCGALLRLVSIIAFKKKERENSNILKRKEEYEIRKISNIFVL